MKTTRATVTGADGAGKTTLIQLIQELSADEPGTIHAYRCPHYHRDSSVPCFALSKVVERLNTVANEREDVSLKVAGLFLGMTFFGDVENHFISRLHPRVLLAERHCLVDSLAYVDVYLPYLKRDFKVDYWPTLLERELGHTAVNQLVAWTEKVRSRSGVGKKELTFWNLPFYIRELFSEDRDVLYRRLKDIYRAVAPDRIFLLEADVRVLSDRLDHREQAGKRREPHERVDLLERLQGSFRKSAQFIQAIEPGTLVHTIRTDLQSVEETGIALLGALHPVSHKIEGGARRL